MSGKARREPAANRTKPPAKSGAPRGGGGPGAPPGPSRGRWVALGLAGAVLAALVVGAVGWWRPRGPTVPVLDLSRVDPSVVRVLEQHLGAVRADRRSAPAWGWLGAMLRAYDFRAAARTCLAEAERLDPREPRWPYFRALLDLVEAPAGAVEPLRRAVRNCGNDPEAPRLRLARLLGEQGRWDEAGRELDALLQAGPDFAPALLVKAHGARNRGQSDLAVELARRCANDPRTARSGWALLAAALRQRGDLPGAVEAARRAASAPADEGFGDPFEAEVALRRGDPRVLSEQAHPLLAAGRLEAAARLIGRLRAGHPEYPDTWLLQGRLQFLLRDLQGAEQSLRRHLELDPQSAQGWFQLGMVVMAQQQFLPAADHFLRATQLKPDYGPAFFNRGIALARGGQRREAAAALRESLRHNPEHLETYALLADLSLQAGDQPEAARLLEQARLLEPGNPRLRPLEARLKSAGP